MDVTWSLASYDARKKQTTSFEFNNKVVSSLQRIIKEIASWRIILACLLAVYDRLLWMNRTFAGHTAAADAAGL